MKLRLALAAATCLVLPLAAHAQPVTGPYVSLEGGVNIQTPFNYNYEDYPGQTGKFLTHEAYAGVGALGYGFGNGFRVELSGDFLRNTIAKDDNSSSYSMNQGVQAAMGPGGGGYVAHGGVNTYGPMVDVLYDLDLGLPVFPYFGAGAGYQWTKFSSHINDPAFGDTIEGTRGSVAYNLIAGISYPLPMVPGLSLTGEYRFMQLVQSRNYATTYGGTSDGPAHIGESSDHTLLIGLRYQLFTPAPAQVAEVSAPAPAPVAAPAPAPARTFLVFFDWDKSDLTPRATQIIAEAASDSKSSSVTTLDVSGYTDTSGTPDYNQGLSQRRAEAVAGQLETDGVPTAEIEIHAYGETHLLVPTGPGVREPQNRRVEIVLQ
jgi:outer membrane protein OmpA-like peptidoglycan-associated protein